MTLLPRVALGLLGLSLGSLLACQMGNPAYDPADGGETRADGDTLGSVDTSAEGNTSIGDGDGDTTPGDGDGDTTPGDGDGDTNPGDGDGDTNTGDGDGDTNTGDGDGDTNTGDGDGDPPLCGDGNVDPGEECDDGNAVDGDMCESDCTLPMMGGDGDGDGMMMEMCPFVMNPITCSDCVNTFCCMEGPLACLENPDCVCVVGCLLGGDPELVCYEEVCGGVDNMVPMLVEGAYECIAQHCPQQCQGG
jgi:cysteine-rich repeat protein